MSPAAFANRVRSSNESRNEKGASLLPMGSWIIGRPPAEARADEAQTPAPPLQAAPLTAFGRSLDHMH